MRGDAGGGDRAAADRRRSRRRRRRSARCPWPPGRAWAGRRRSGPGRCWARCASAGGASDVGPRSVSPNAISVSGLALRSSVAASPVTPITGVAERPAPIAGSGGLAGLGDDDRAGADRRRGRGLGGGVRSRLDDHDLAAGCGSGPCRARPCRWRVTGPAVWPFGGGSPASTAASAMCSPSSVSSVRGCGSVAGQGADGEAVAGGGGRADRPAPGRRRALVAGGGDDQRSQALGALDRLGLGGVGEARVGRVDADERRPSTWSEVSPSPLGSTACSMPASSSSVVACASTWPPTARKEAIRIGSTRWPRPATTPASAVPLVSWRPLRLPGLGSRSRSTAS